MGKLPTLRLGCAKSFPPDPATCYACPMRKTVLFLALVYAILFGIAAFLNATATTDAAGRGMAWGFWIVGAGFTACFTTPAVILVACDRLPRLALVLALVPGLVLLLLLADGLI